VTTDTSIVILDGGRRTPRADILVNNREPGLFSRFSTTQLGGLAIHATLAHTKVDRTRVGHVVMGMAQHSHRDSIYGARGMSLRGGLPEDVPALTVARICGSGAEAVAVGAEMILAGLRHDAARPFVVVGGAESMQYPLLGAALALGRGGCRRGIALRPRSSRKNFPQAVRSRRRRGRRGSSGSPRHRRRRA
jgi:acetyl-CoA acetyltransferase